MWCAQDETIHTDSQRFTHERNTSPLLNHTVLRLKTFSRCWRVVCRASAAKCLKLVGIDTDGESANIAASGLKGLVERCLCWVFWMYRMAHHLELAIKDALKFTAFDVIADPQLLLRIYFSLWKITKNMQGAQFQWSGALPLCASPCHARSSSSLVPQDPEVCCGNVFCNLSTTLVTWP